MGGGWGKCSSRVFVKQDVGSQMTYSSLFCLCSRRPCFVSLGLIVLPVAVYQR